MNCQKSWFLYFDLKKNFLNNYLNEVIVTFQNLVKFELIFMNSFQRVSQKPFLVVSTSMEPTIEVYF